MRNLSAKDRAFEEERARYRKRIRELEQEIREMIAAKAAETAEMKERIQSLEAKNQKLEEQNKRLLSCVNLSEEDLRRMMDGSRFVAETAKTLSGLIDFGAGGSLQLKKEETSNE